MFINFYDLDGAFDEVAFSENPAIGGYQSEITEVGFFTHIGGVPEPSTWAMLLLGFAGLGFCWLSFSRRNVAVSA